MLRSYRPYCFSRVHTISSLEPRSCIFGETSIEQYEGKLVSRQAYFESILFNAPEGFGNKIVEFVSSHKLTNCLNLVITKSDSFLSVGGDNEVA